MEEYRFKLDRDILYVSNLEDEKNDLEQKLNEAQQEIKDLKQKAEKSIKLLRNV